ncbi:glycosyltransferase [Vibrio sp. 10N.222.55.C12]|uniref:glycosyltransferase n=1 Tax=Vibrio sp. 10N.222.55.C12 TaxID=1884470 RepID=UPI000C81DBDD|nr:glycosyltransferase [Vibrio sp. 10N.222.55.C12]PMN96595.1 hypothetical protein BCT20_02195 [Vibrio sp. 10N.222.55.C12]
MSVEYTKSVSIYGGHIYAATGVSAVLRELKDGEWHEYNVEHSVLSFDSEISNTEVAVKYTLRKKLLSKFRVKIWEWAEKSSLIAEYYFKYSNLFRVKTMLTKHFVFDSDTCYIIHDVWTLLQFKRLGYSLTNVIFVIHGSLTPTQVLVTVFPSLCNSKFIEDLNFELKGIMSEIKSLIALSELSRRNFSYEFGARSVTISNGISPLNTLRENHSNDMSVHCAGTVCLRKRQYLIFEIVDLLGVDFIRNNNISFHIYGDGPLLEHLKDKASAYKGYGVNFYGNMKEPFTRYSKGDIILSLSTEEGLPIALLEGLRAGCVPIVTNVGACNEVVESNGYLINATLESDVVREFSNALSEVVKYNKTLSENSINLFNSKFSSKAMLKKYAEEIKRR